MNIVEDRKSMWETQHSDFGNKLYGVSLRTIYEVELTGIGGM